MNNVVFKNTVFFASINKANNNIQLVEKVCFFKKMLVLNPYPQTPFPGKGAKCGAAALTPLGATPQTPFFKVM